MHTTVSRDFIKLPFYIDVFRLSLFTIYFGIPEEVFGSCKNPFVEKFCFDLLLFPLEKFVFPSMHTGRQQLWQRCKLF